MKNLTTINADEGGVGANVLLAPGGYVGRSTNLFESLRNEVLYKISTSAVLIGNGIPAVRLYLKCVINKYKLTKVLLITLAMHFQCTIRKVKKRHFHRFPSQ